MCVFTASCRGQDSTVASCVPTAVAADAVPVHQVQIRKHATECAVFIQSLQRKIEQVAYSCNPY